MCEALGLESWDARLFMVFDGQYKLMHSAAEGHRPMLFDLVKDPKEYDDVGGDPAYRAEIDRLYGYLHEWALRMAQRVTMSERKLRIKRGSPQREGILVGIHHAEELPLKFTEKYLGKARQIHFEDPADLQRYGGEAPEPKED